VRRRSRGTRQGSHNLLQSTAGRSSDWRLWRHGVAVVEAGVAGGGAAPPDCSSPPPDFRSLQRPPLFPSLSIGAAGACGVPARAIPLRFPARASPVPLPACAPRACPFPCVFPYRFSRERTTSRSVWRPSDAMATPFFTRRRHTPESRGGLDAAIQKSPGRQGDAMATPRRRHKNHVPSPAVPAHPLNTDCRGSRRRATAGWLSAPA